MKTLMQLRRRIGKHQNVQEEKTHFQEGQSAKSDPAANFELLVAVKWRERSTIPYILSLPFTDGKVHHSLYFMTHEKGSWVMKTLMQLHRRIGKHQNVLEE